MRHRRTGSRRPAAGRRRRPAQLGLDARQQLHHLERLGDVVVGAELQADDLVDDLAARGQHDHRRLDAAAAQLAQHVEAVHPRQHHVEQDEIERPPMPRARARSRRRRWSRRRSPRGSADRSASGRGPARLRRAAGASRRVRGGGRVAHDRARTGVAPAGCSLRRAAGAR